MYVCVCGCVNGLASFFKGQIMTTKQDPKVAAQMAPFLNDDFKSMMEDTAKFREEIQKVCWRFGVG